MRLSIKTAGAALFAVGLGLLGASGAQANPFAVGSISLSGGGLTTPVPPPPTTSIVSQLNTFTQSSSATVTGGSCTGVFGSCPPPSGATAFTFSTLSPTGNVYQVTIGSDLFTFDLTSISPGITRNGLSGSSGSYTDSVSMTLQGALTDSLGNFASTAFTGAYSANGACTGPASPTECTGNVSSSWSVSLSATGTQAPPVPEPASLSLLGAGLLGLGAVRRRFGKR